MSLCNWRLGKKFENQYPHQGSIEILWKTMWQPACAAGTYPFQEGHLDDFEPIFSNLIKNDINDGYSDAYTNKFLPVAEDLVRKAASLELTNKDLASSYYLRAAAVYRIARFPYISSAVKREAFDAQKIAFLKGASFWAEPTYEEQVPHPSASPHEKNTIPAYVRVPSHATSQTPVPILLLLSGLDRYRPDYTNLTDEFVARGWASVVVEIPGTADSPADPKDPSSADRVADSVFSWMRKKEVFDMKKVIAWGLSTGGYYGVRMAHTHSKFLKGAIGQGAGVHFFLSRQWLDQTDGHEYPFAFTPAFSRKHGFDTVEEFKQQAQSKFSLLLTGVLNQPSTRLLLLNGIDDGLMPIEDSMLLMEHGRPKEGRFFANAHHMGYPGSLAAVWPWLEEIMNCGDGSHQQS